MNKKKTIRDINIQGKKVLIRVDFNVPLHADGSIADDNRIRSSIPTLQYLIEQDASIIIMSHLGRPTGNQENDKNLKMKKVSERLKELLPDIHIEQSDQVIGEKTNLMAHELKKKSLLLLENLRFDPGEKEGDEGFAAKLKELGEFYVNDAFGSCHRKDASMYALPLLFPRDKCAIGFLIEKELEVLNNLLLRPEKPVVAIIGGAKISGKLGFIESLVAHFDYVLIGGALSYTCLKALGGAVGASLVDNEGIEVIKKIIIDAKDKIRLPIDHVVVNSSLPSLNCKIVHGSIPNDWSGMDIGPETIETYSKIILKAGTVLWNGPLGKFEDERFRNGTKKIANCIASARAVSVVGGGETSEAVASFGLTNKMTFISTGGGAFLEYLEKRSLPALTVIGEI